ncbi:MAG: GNAT family N-acetyltransferase [Cyanobacteria bacterium K_Offshore_surface_m2_239]|nr:GNAT family N-acetyltransferase [Cyanobacteria bacterium K_Offshore_surface_m2_239]
MFEEQRLDPSRHNRKAFRCGVEALDRFWAQQAGQNRRRGFGETFVLVEASDPDKILGYYTLAPAQVERVALQPDDAASLPLYPVPCCRMGRLALDLSCRGQGLGSLLLALAVERCLEVRQSIGGYALLVDAKDEVAVQFYAHHGFRRFQDSPRSLYLPLGPQSDRGVDSASR